MKGFRKLGEPLFSLGIPNRLGLGDRHVAGGVVPLINRVKALNPIAYWTLGDASGLTAVDEMGLGNGTYTAGVTLGQAGIGDGRTAAYFNNSSHRCDIYSPALNATLTPNAMTVFLFATADNWNDGIINTLLSLRVDLNNRLVINNDSTANKLAVIHTAGGVTNSLAYTMSPGPTTFFQVAVTVSTVDNLVIVYVNGAEVARGLTVPLGTWAGALSSTRCLISGQSTSDVTNTHKGKAAHAAIWNRALTPTEVASISSPFDSNATLSYLLSVGDSKTSGTGDDVGVTPPGYQAPLCQLLHTANGSHYSENPPRIGVGGIDVANMKARVDADIAGMTVAPTEVLINLGANDVGAGFNKATWKTNYLYIVDAYHTAFANANIRLAKIWVRDTGTQAAAIVLQNEAIDEMYIARTWLKAGINEALFLEGGDNGVTYTTDGTHPNHAGYALEAAAWKTAITGI